MSGAYLPVTPEVRDRANAYLRGMAARGFGTTVEEAVRLVSPAHRVDCGNCYGNGCLACGNRGWVETDAGREAREEAEDRRADERRHEPREDL